MVDVAPKINIFLNTTLNRLNAKNQSKEFHDKVTRIEKNLRRINGKETAHINDFTACVGLCGQTGCGDVPSRALLLHHNCTCYQLLFLRGRTKRKH